MEHPRYVIASGPSGIRLRLADDLATRFAVLGVQSYELWRDPNYDGTSTDYRHAVKLAAEQATWEGADMPVIFTHSLLDGLAYATLTVERHARFDNVSEYTRDKWLLTFGVIGAMFRDSFRAEQVIFLNLYGEGEDGYEVQERVRLILDEFHLPYTELDTENLTYQQLFEQAATIIGADLDGTRRATSQSAQDQD